MKSPKTPTGGNTRQRDDMQPALPLDLFDTVFERENLNRAWQRVRANKGKSGVDGVTIEEFPNWLNHHWKKTLKALQSGVYQPSPVKRVEINKPDGGKRLLGIPTIVDRLIQQAISQKLTPIIDPTFSSNSYGFRPKCSAHQAVKQVQQEINQKRRIAIDVDLSKCFDRINHDLVMSKLRVHVKDKRVLRLIGRYLRAGIMKDNHFHSSIEGTPQGGPLSPLLANVLLDSLDKELERRGHRFARYADDFIILVKSERAGKRVLSSISRYLQQRLKLVVNTDKSQVVKTSQSKFLGFTFGRGHILIHQKTIHRFKQQVRKLTNRNWGVSMVYQLNRLRHYLRGWINYFGIASAFQQCVNLDQWIRRRIRMAYWRQWKKPRTKIKNLLKLGVSKGVAISCGLSSKGPWRNSKTPGIQEGLSNAFLKSEGLFSLRDGWIQLHYPNG